MRIARLTAADAPEYRTLMLEAYATAPDAFASTAEERAAEPLAWWERRIADREGLGLSFGAYSGDTMAGTVALEFTNRPKTRHSALLIGMYVRPAMRGQGLGAQLVRAALAAARARSGVEVVRLTVTEGNAAAIRLYESLGFVAWGVEPHALRLDDGLRGRVHMIVRLSSADAAGPATGPGPGPRTGEVT